MASVVSGLTPRALRFRLFETFRIASEDERNPDFPAWRLLSLAPAESLFQKGRVRASGGRQPPVQ